MADPIISALVNELLGRLTSAAIREYGLFTGLKKDLSALNKTFQKIQRVLDDAEEKQKTQKNVEEWLRDLKSASLEAENVLGEAKTEAMIRRLHREMGKKHRIRAFFSSRYNSVMVRFRIAHKVKDIRKKLQDIDNNRYEFQLISNTTSEDGAGIGDEILDRETSSLMSKICGRDEEKKMIVDRICSQHDNDDVRVYAVWGMGGIGKTTLAKYVYNHETVNRNFDLKVWVYVSVVFDVKQIIKAICGSEDSGLDAMQARLQEKLRRKKFLIVMDDVWLKNKDMQKWDELYNGLSCGAKGSTVLVTTREKDIAQRMATIRELQHNVGVLSDEDSWSLFEILAFPGRGEGENVSSELEHIGKDIVKKCKGLPLAVKTLGSLMSTKERVDQWQRVNKNFKWEKDDKLVLPTLKLSYDDLPPHMKICFAYCCVFLKGGEMSKESLIDLWMVNGFIPSQGYASLYEHGEKIFDCLVRRSFFQDVVEKDTEMGAICKMHDLMHDLAQDVMKHDFAVIEPGEEEESITQDVLHLSLSGKDFKFSKENLGKLISVRSMFVYNIDYTSDITEIFNRVSLRVLYLQGITSSPLPESICKLIHLRYLKISRSNIEVLPESIIYLQNLQTLILEECQELRELPKGLRYMKNLQHLDIKASYMFSFLHMPVGIEKLTDLRRLSHFVVGEHGGARIGELGKLNRLGCCLRLCGLGNLRGSSDAKSANLKDKKYLKSLILGWWYNRLGEPFDSNEVVEGLEPNSGLQELTIQYYMGTVLSPSWLVKLVNLTSIKFHNVESIKLPPLGKLRSLKRINLEGMVYLECFHDVDNSTSKDEILFPSLQQLHISSCFSLVSLPSNFPKLKSLTIEGCEKLRSLPDEIQSFKDLNQITIENCKILSRRCEKEIGEDWPKISHIPHLKIQPPRVRECREAQA